MGIITDIARRHFAQRVRHLQSIAGSLETVQRRQLARLLSAARSTEYVKAHGGADSYEQWAERFPPATYEEVRPYVERMVRGERDVLWRGRCRRFAQSSGTSDGRSKFVPVTDDSLRWCHYRGASDAVAHYLAARRHSRMFEGKGFILGGSFSSTITPPPGVKIGDLSANLIEAINPVVNLFRVPSKRVALMEKWEEKLHALVEASLRADVTNISGVPSWFLTVLKRVLEAAGASEIHQVWPHLEVFLHGGISFKPYRDQYDAIIDPSRMTYVETYNASEGFFAVQSDLADPAMLLLPDVGVFYELLPLDALGTPEERKAIIPCWKARAGVSYELIITACNGLWRYRIGDTVTVASLNPLKILIAGRTKHYINAFGEELMVHNAEAAIAAAQRATGLRVLNYTAAPVYTTSQSHGRHQWLIEWDSQPTTEQIERFARALDDALRSVNSDYDAKRTGDIFLDRLSITTAVPGLFDRWLASTGKLGGQRKVPRLSNSRDIIDRMLTLNS